MKTDPFANYKIRIKKVDRGYLQQKEIEAIMAKKFSTKRLDQVRDIFIFSYFCGLAYIDVKNPPPVGTIFEPFSGRSKEISLRK